MKQKHSALLSEVSEIFGLGFFEFARRLHLSRNQPSENQPKIVKKSDEENPDKFRELIDAHPTFVEDGISLSMTNPISAKGNPIEKILGDVKYEFVIYNSIRVEHQFFLHIKRFQDNSIIKTVIYHLNLNDDISSESILEKINNDKDGFNFIMNNKQLFSPFIPKEANAQLKNKENTQSEQKIDQSGQRRMEEAKNKFESKQGLAEEVEKEIIPALVQIIAKNGIMGTGFFPYSEWLVSNAHIIPAKEVLDKGAQIVDYELNELALYADSSYHRPSNNEISPDIVIVKTHSRSEAKHKDLLKPPNDDESFEKSYIFYVDVNWNDPENSEIKFLQLRSKPGTYPLIYQCEGENEPQPGNSGTPIIEAHVILGREPKWQFEVIGALYARCSSNWYNQSNAVTSLVASDTKLVCAIPIRQDLLQILQILHRNEEAIRAQQMAYASKSLGDEQGKRDAEKYSVKSQENIQAQQLELKKFEAGESPLNIALPDGLEKLWYKGIVGIECSLLIGDVLKRQLGKNAYKFKDKVPNTSLAELQKDFHNFIEEIKKIAAFELKEGDTVEKSPAGYFRIDVGIGGKKPNTYWMLDIQDNTGKYHSNNQPLSSVFAKVTVPKNQVSVSGSQLSELFLNSQNEKKAKDISSLGTVNSHAPSTKKQDNYSSHKSSFNSKQKKQGIDPEHLKNALMEALASIEEDILQEVIKVSIKEQGSLSKVALQNSANLYEFTCHDVNRDGNCFFHVLSDQLKRYGYIVSSKKLKEIAVDHILENLQIYEPFIGETNAFINSLLNRDEWADHIIIQALSRALRVNIVLIRSDGQQPNVFRRANAVAVLCLGYEVGLHYQSLHPNLSYQKEKIISLIDSTDADEVVIEDANILERYIHTHSNVGIEEASPITTEEETTITATSPSFQSPLSSLPIEREAKERKNNSSNTVKTFFPTNKKEEKEQKLENPKIDKDGDKKNLNMPPPPFL